MTEDNFGPNYFKGDNKYCRMGVIILVTLLTVQVVSKILFMFDIVMNEFLPLTETMDLDTLTNAYKNQKLERLKHDLRNLIKRAGKHGVKKSTIFSDLTRETKKGTYLKQEYGLNKMTDVIEIHMRDEVELIVPDTGPSKLPVYRMIEESVQSVPQLTSDDFPQLGSQKEQRNVSNLSRRDSYGAIPKTKSMDTAQRAPTNGNGASATDSPFVDLTTSDQELDSDEDEDLNIPSVKNTELETLTGYKLDEVKDQIHSFMIPRSVSGIKLSKLANFLKKALNKLNVKCGKIDHLRAYTFFKTNCLSYLVLGKTSSKKSMVFFKSESKNVLSERQVIQEPVANGNDNRNAMSLMSALSAWGKPAGVKIDDKEGNINQNAQRNPVPSENFISLVDDDGDGMKPDPKQVIEIRDDSESPKPGPSWGLIGQPFQAQAVQQSFIQQMTSLQIPSQPQGSAALTIPPLVLTNPLAIPSNNNPFAMSRQEPSLPGARDTIIDLTITPVNRAVFELKQVNVRPVFVRQGQPPARDYVNTIAKECIDAIADANEYVTQPRVEMLLCQRFQCHNVRQLGFGFVDQIPCVNEMNRMVAKINLYVLGFVKSRSICTLYELKECLREYVPNKEDFLQLKLGPLQRFSVVYEQFRFPPDMAVIPEITSMNILDLFHNYLTKFSLWTKRLELEPFMEYLVKEYSADQAFQLGVRIRSLPLAAGVSSCI